MSPDSSSLDILAALSDLPSMPDGSIFKPDPFLWAEACSSPHADEWRCSFQGEIDSLKNMNIYTLVPWASVPSGRHIHTGKPVFHVKCDMASNVCWHKVQLVFQGFEQVHGKDFDKTTSPMACMESWHILLHLAAHLGWDA
jgi:hypothetical protein